MLCSTSKSTARLLPKKQEQVFPNKAGSHFPTGCNKCDVIFFWTTERLKHSPQSRARSEPPHTQQPVSITKSDSSDQWIVHTDCGPISCHTVVHATNAHSAAQTTYMQSLRAATRPERSHALRNPYGVLLQDGAVLSINPRCSSDGNVMFGGSNPGQKKLDKWSAQSSERCVDDGLANLESVTKEVRAFVESEFLDSKEEVQYAPGEGWLYVWTGIIGLSTDGVSFVGEVSGEKGVWVCAGHHGQ
jgi:glycine/D-amino acid oxidase-like deaminating enzyme